MNWVVSTFFTVLMFVNLAHANTPALATGVCDNLLSSPVMPRQVVGVLYYEPQPELLTSSVPTMACREALVNECIVVNELKATLEHVDSPKYLDFQDYFLERKVEVISCTKWPENEEWEPQEVGKGFPINHLNPHWIPIADDFVTAPSLDKPIIFPFPTPNGIPTIITIPPDSRFYPMFEQIIRILSDPNVQTWVKNGIIGVLILAGITLGAELGSIVLSALAVPTMAVAAASIVTICMIGGVAIDKKAFDLDSGTSMIQQEKVGVESYSITGPNQQIQIQKQSGNILHITNGETCYQADPTHQAPIQRSLTDC